MSDYIALGISVTALGLSVGSLVYSIVVERRIKRRKSDLVRRQIMQHEENNARLREGSATSSPRSAPSHLPEQQKEDFPSRHPEVRSRTGGFRP